MFRGLGPTQGNGGVGWVYHGFTGIEHDDGRFWRPRDFLDLGPSQGPFLGIGPWVEGQGKEVCLLVEGLDVDFDPDPVVIFYVVELEVGGLAVYLLGMFGAPSLAQESYCDGFVGIAPSPFSWDVNVEEQLGGPCRDGPLAGGISQFQWSRREVVDCAGVGGPLFRKGCRGVQVLV